MADTGNSLMSLQLSGGQGVAYRAWPVTQGIPLASGQLERGEAVRVVDSRGCARPTQSRCLATWDADLKYVRWLLVDFQADLDPGQASELRLETGSSPAPSEAIRLEQTATHLEIDTGPLHWAIRHPGNTWHTPAPGGLLTSWRVDGEELLSEEAGLCLYMVDQFGVRYESSSSPPPLVEVEEEGPLRASICVRGFHASEQGGRFCPYVLRLHFFAGRSDVRVCHTFVYDQDPNRIEISGVGLRLPLEPGSEPRAAIGGMREVHSSVGPGELSLLQVDDENYEVRREGSICGRGSRPRGWASLSGARGSVVAVMRDSWQEYPKGYRLDAEGLDIQVWPRAYGQNLAFRTPFEETAIRFDRTREESEVVRLLAENPGAPLNLKSFDIQSPADLLWVESMVDQYAPERPASHNDTGIDNGMGAAKTTDIWLRLEPGAAPDDESEQFALSVQEPLLAPADPVHTCASGAVGHFYHAGDPRFEAIDEGLDDLVRTVAIEPEEICHTYGMMRYGNAVCSHSAGPAVAYVHYKDSQPDRALRHVGPYNNETNDQTLGLWGSFLRTGRREHFLRARTYSRAVADVAIIHAHVDASRVGLMHYHSCHQWSGGPSPSHTLVSGILVDYYLSGDRRLLDVAEEVAGWAVRTQEPAGIISCRNGTLHREFAGPLWGLLEVYQATWNEAYGDLAQRSLNWFLRALPAPGRYPLSVYTRGDRGDEAVVEPDCPPSGHARDMYHVFAIGMRLFPSQALREHILAEADYFVWDYLTDNFVTAEMAQRSLTPRSLLWEVEDGFYWTQWGASGNSDAQVACLAYELTGDLVYAAYCRDQLDGTFVRQAKRSRQYADWRFTWLGFGSFVPRLMRTVASALDEDPEGLAQALADWRSRRAEKGMPVYVGPGVDLESDRMDVNGNILNRAPTELPRNAPARTREPLRCLGQLSTAPHPSL